MTIENVNVAYQTLLKKILIDGVERPDPNRRGTYRKQIPFWSFTVDLRDGFPALTTKRVFFRGVVAELMWFLSGRTDIHFLHERGVHIWDADWKRWGKDDLGPIYGHQWRNFSGVDQIEKLIETLKVNPLSSAMVVSAWNPPQLHEMALPPCHWAFQVTCEPRPGGGYFLDLAFNMRSSDVFLGLPFNIASYALLMHVFCKLTGHFPRFLRYNGVNVHLYDNQLDAAKIQSENDPLKYGLPTLVIKKDLNRLEDFWNLSLNDICLRCYRTFDNVPSVKVKSYN